MQSSPDLPTNTEREALQISATYTTNWGIFSCLSLYRVAGYEGPTTTISSSCDNYCSKFHLSPRLYPYLFLLYRYPYRDNYIRMYLCSLGVCHIAPAIIFNSELSATWYNIIAACHVPKGKELTRKNKIEWDHMTKPRPYGRCTTDC